MATGSNLSHSALMTDWVAGSILIDDWRNSQKQAHIQLGDLTGSGPPEPHATPVPLGVAYISRPANEINKGRAHLFVHLPLTSLARTNFYWTEQQGTDLTTAKGSILRRWWFDFGNLVIILLFSLPFCHFKHSLQLYRQSTLSVPTSSYILNANSAWLIPRRKR